MSRFALPLLAALVLTAGCGVGPADDHARHPHDDIDPAFWEQSAEELSPSMTTVGQIADGWLCSTAGVRGLSEQIASEVNCIAPGNFTRIDDISGVTLGPAALPFLQKTAADALRASVREAGLAVHLNSTWRSPIQQYLLKTWEGSCGIGVAASPGYSNHESGLAFDTDHYGYWNFRKALSKRSLDWYCTWANAGYEAGCNDPVHFDTLSGTDLRSTGVLAFQRLWNLNNPHDPIAEDGGWGPATAARARRAPARGFAKGSTCGVSLASTVEPEVQEPVCGSFADVPTSHPAWGAIEAGFAKGFWTGCSESPRQFCPGETFDRAQLAAMLASALRLPQRPAQGLFEDVPVSHWAASAIESIYLAGISNGCGEGWFCPEWDTTRAELAILLSRAMEIAPIEPRGRFEDVPEWHWAAHYVEAAARHGLMGGCGDDTFCPDDVAKRYELALVLTRALDIAPVVACPNAE